MHKTLLGALSISLGGISVGALIGTLGPAWAGWAVVSLTLGFQLYFHLRHLILLDKWTTKPSADAALEGEGDWDKVFGRLYRHEKEIIQAIAQRDAEIAQFEAAGQALTDGVVLLDEHDQITWCNSTAEHQLGLVLNKDRGQHVVNLLRHPDFVSYLNTRAFDRPLIMRTAKASVSRVLAVHILPYAQNKRLMQVKDVTQADRLDSMRRDFVANVSHELRTPLTVLAGFLETLQEIDVDRAEQQRFISMMLEQSNRMQSIVQDLLTLSSLEAAPPPEGEIVDMASLLNKLKRDGELLSNGRHTIVLEMDSDADLRGSDHELISALGNLVANAVRYTPAEGRITISWRLSQQGALFAVQDTGIGIDPKHIPRLTERFYRVDRGRSRDSGGTGLGLAIVKHALSRHQAHLEITSQPGEGSCFAAHFPSRRLVLPQ